MNKSDYVSIPKRSIWSLLGLVVLGLSTYYHFHNWIIPEFREFFSDIEKISLKNIWFVWVLVSVYIMIVCNIYFLLSVFKKPKNFYGLGLVFRLVETLITGVFIGLVSGFTIGILVCLVWGIVVGIVVGIVMGIFIWLFVGIIMGLFLGIINEFR